jgi:hypothetical protein
MGQEMIRASILAFMLSATSVAAQDAPKCGGFADLAAALAKDFGEAQRFVGIDGRGLMIVMTLNAETGSWTALQVEAGGRACMVAAGMSGEFMDPPKPGDPT